MHLVLVIFGAASEAMDGSYSRLSEGGCSPVVAGLEQRPFQLEL